MARHSTLRASDADREHVVARLRKAASEGRLLAEELEQRLGAALTARTYGQLDELVADLPSDHVPAPRSRGSFVRRSAVALGALAVAAALVALVVLLITGTIVAGGAWLFFGFMFFGCRRRYSRYGDGRYPRYGCRVPAGRWR